MRPAVDHVTNLHRRFHGISDEAGTAREDASLIHLIYPLSGRFLVPSRNASAGLSNVPWKRLYRLGIGDARRQSRNTSAVGY